MTNIGTSPARMPASARDGLAALVDLDAHPLGDANFRASCRAQLDHQGVLVLENFLTPGALDQVVAEAEEHRLLAYFTKEVHTVYLDSPDSTLAPSDARSRPIVSTKGALTTDQLPDASPCRALYGNAIFTSFVADVLGEAELFPYADPLSSINVNFFDPGQELGWHFDNSSFAVTLLVREAEAGGRFEKIDSLRDSAAGFDNPEGVAAAMDAASPDQLAFGAGALSLFRGRDTLHRVTPVEGRVTRILIVLAYNTEAGISLSESARMTFFGRLG